jgi:predicted Zn-ribbon and HTH transcriptional regulator
MAMKKAEMEFHQSQYLELMRRAREAQGQGLYRRAIECALATWEHIDGMMQYERKYRDASFDSVESIDLVLRFAPLLFDFPSLDSLETLLKRQRRIERDTTDDLGARVSQARALMADAHRLWTHLERNPESRQDELAAVLGGDQRRWRSMAEAWEAMSLLRRTPERRSYQLALSTRMGEVVPAKCSRCGTKADAPKAMFLEALTCPQCRSAADFVILSGPVAAGARG